MSNDYYNATTTVTEDSKARSSTINAILQAIKAGFDLLPGKDKLHQNRVTYYADSGAADAYVVTMSPAITAYSGGLHLRVKIGNTNTGASTINVNSLGVRSIKLFDNTAPVAGDMTAGDIVDLVYDDARTVFLLIGQSRSYVASAQTAATAAETAQGLAEAAWDSFDDRYLGTKASDPTEDNDGDPLAEGMIYWETGSGFRVYDGSDWDQAFFNLNGALVAANNLSDLTNAATARTNLGLGTMATETATTYMPKAGGTFTGPVKMLELQETLATALSGTTLGIDLEAGTKFTLTTSGNTTFTFSNPAASGTVSAFTLEVTAGGTHTLTWPASVEWPGGTAPGAPASGEKNRYVFETSDGGTTWSGGLVGEAYA